MVEAQEQMEEQKRAHKKEMDDLEHAFLAARERLQVTILPVSWRRAADRSGVCGVCACGVGGVCDV